MAIDARTMLLLTMGIAAIAAGFLWNEWRSLRGRSLPFWSGGFAVIAIGCGMSPLREAGYLVFGVWVPNSMLMAAHLLFLFGAARFAQRPLSPLMWGGILAAGVLLTSPLVGLSMQMRGVLQSAVIGALALKAGLLLLRPPVGEQVAAQLGTVLLLHAASYVIKAGLILVPGAYGDVTTYEGFIIPLSLLEGVLAEVLLALLMVGAVRQRREREIEALAQLDPLTGIYNRRAFEERAGEALARGAAKGRPGALMLLDVDHFKAINDTFGHGAGDRILTTLTEAVGPLLPPRTVFARVGGDEFVLLLVDAAEDQVEELAATIRTRFGAACRERENAPMAATVSIGSARFAGKVRLVDLISRADAALYEAKRRGRDQHFSGSIETLVPRRARAAAHTS